jgi:hypothetical protein
MSLGESLEQHHRSDAVDDRVVQFEQERGASASKPPDQIRLPERAQVIERRHEHTACKLQQTARTARLRQHNFTQMVIEMEMPFSSSLRDDRRHHFC